MGLDMGLVKKQKAGQDVAYWRKANQLREWFAENLTLFQDNGETRVEKEDLEKLLETINKVLETPAKADQLMPTSEGFFFGSTEYDDRYWEELKRTKETLEKILAETNWDKEEIYYWEWY